MRTTTDKMEFRQAYIDTPLAAVCVKKRGKRSKDQLRLIELMKDREGHGKLVYPVVVRQTFAGCIDQEQADKILQDAVKQSAAVTVKVRGHSWGLPYEDDFVWTGTVAEFSETWEID